MTASLSCSNEFIKIANKTKSVCIIGAGVAGLIAIRHVSKSEDLVGTVFEKSGSLGGIWVYSDETGPDRTPMYKHMRTNLPKETMRYIDHPFELSEKTIAEEFKDKSTSYIHHSYVLKYLHEYADKFNLRQFIKFNTRVVRVEPVFLQNTHSSSNIVDIVRKWKVRVQSEYFQDDHNGSVVHTNKKYEDLEFDSVMVCTGNFTYPFVPDSYNISEFTGEVLHSKDYRTPDCFANKTVLVVGRGNSAIDISLELAEVAKQVFLSSRQKDPLKSTFPAKVKHVPGIKLVKKNAFVFTNDEEIYCDVIIWCTGYQYSFPFLAPECGVKVEQGKAVTPLYRHMVHTNFPTLCFIGLVFHINPFTIFDAQARYFIKYLEGKVALPSVKEMLQDIEKEKYLKKELGLTIDYYHQLGERQWAYFNTLASETKFSFPEIKVIEKICDKAHHRRWNFVTFYKDDIVRVLDSETFQYIESGSGSC